MKNVTRISGRRVSLNPEVEAEARTWLIRLDGDPSREDILQFRSWLHNSPLHRQVFQQTAAAWEDLDGLAEVYFREGGKHTRETGGDRSLTSSVTLTARVILASLVLLVGTITWFLRPWSEDGAREAGGAPLAYATAIGEIKSVSLPDGSRVQMNSNTRMEVAYTGDTRLIHLGDGEAYFEVARDAAKPFFVSTGKYLVKATGTAFAVEILNDGLDVLVTEGRVEVSTFNAELPNGERAELRNLTDAASIVPLEQGQKIVLNNRNGMPESIQRVATENIEKDLSWRDGMLIFEDDTLSYVISEINRYTPTRIILSDARIRDLRFGGYFRIDDVPAILATMEENFGIKVDRINDQLIYLSQRETPL